MGMGGCRGFGEGERVGGWGVQIGVLLSLYTRAQSKAVNGLKTPSATCRHNLMIVDTVSMT